MSNFIKYHVAYTNIMIVTLLLFSSSFLLIINSVSGHEEVENIFVSSLLSSLTSHHHNPNNHELSTRNSVFIDLEEDLNTNKTVQKQSIYNSMNMLLLNNNNDDDNDDNETISDISSSLYGLFQRSLTIGDFDRFNQLFQGAEIALPDSSLSQDNLDITLTNLKCYNINIGDIITQWNIDNTSTWTSTEASNGSVTSGNIEILQFEINIIPFSVDCSADYTFSAGLFGLIDGSGTLTASSTNSSAGIRIDLKSDYGFDNDFPKSIDLGYCNTSLNINNIVFNGPGIIDNILNLLNGLVTNIVEDQAKDAICSKLSTSMPTLFTNLLEKMKSRIDTWMQPVSNDLTNPLYIEQYNFTKPRRITLLEFMPNGPNDTTTTTSLFGFGDDDDDDSSKTTSNETKKTSTIGNLLVMAIKQADSLLGNLVNDPDSLLTGTNGSDLAINVMLRQSSLLNDERILNVDISENNNDNDSFFLFDSTTFNPVIYESDGGMLTSSKITISSIRITGLDTITVMEPFHIIGNYTLQNTISWDKLLFELDLIINMKPSTSNQSILVNPDTSFEITENITISIDFSKIHLNTSLFVAIDIIKLEQLQLGSLIYTENLLSCFMEAIYDLQVSSLTVKVDDMSQPTISGFITPGLDRVIKSITDAGLAAFEPTIIKAMPNLFQGPVRKILSKQFLDGSFNSSSSSMKCPTNHQHLINTSPKYIDYRDMLLPSNESIKLGGTGNEKMYGTLMKRMYNMIEEKLNEIDGNGQPFIDQMLIRPFTKRQSGIDGMLHMKRDIFTFGTINSTKENDVSVLGDNESNIYHNNGTKSNRVLQSSILNDLLDSSSQFSSNMYISFSNIRVYNLDTVALPITILHPTNDATTLTNELNIGNNNNNASLVGGRPLNVTVLLSLGSSDVMNKIDISTSFDTLGVIFDMLALIQTDMFAKFPLGEILNLDCWLATMPSLELNEDGIPMNLATARSLAIKSFNATMTSFAFDATCIDCQSSGTSYIPSLLQIFNETNATTTLGLRIPLLLDTIMKSNTIQTVFDRRINDATMFCPSTNPNYYNTDNVLERSKYDNIVLPALDATSLDTLLYAMTLISEVGIVVFAKSQLDVGIIPSDPLSIQKSFVIPNGMRVIDWTDLSGSTGFGAIIDELFNQARQSLGTISSNSLGNGFFNINGLIENFLEGGILKLPLNLGMKQDDLSFEIKSVRIFGLNDFVLKNMLQPIGPQTLSFSAQFSKLKVELEVVADSSITSNPQPLIIDFSMKKLNINIALFAAFDLDKIGNLKLGSLLSTSTLLRCILSTAHRFEIPEMNVTVESFTTPKFKGFMTDTSLVISQATEKIFVEYKREIIEAIPIIFGGVLKDSISNLLSVFYADSSCPNAAVALSEFSYVDFRDLFLPEDKSKVLGGSGLSPYGNLFRSVYTFLSDEFLITDPETNLAAINEKLISKFTNARTGTSGEWLLDGDLINQNRRVNAGGLNAFFKIRIYDGYVKNLDTVGAPLGILEPINGQASILNNSATMGIGRPLVIGSSILISLSDDGTNITNDLDFSVRLDKLHLLATAMIKLSEKAFFDFPVKDFAKLSCWLATMQPPQLDGYGVRLPGSNTSLGIEEFAGSMDKVGLNITCKSCSGPLLGKLTELLSLEQNSDDVTNVTNAALALFTDLVKGDYLKVAIDRALNDAPYQCPHSPLYAENYAMPVYAPFAVNDGPDSVSFLIAIMIVFTTVLAMVVAMQLVTKAVVRRRHRKWLTSLHPEQLHLLFAVQNEKKEKESELNVSTTSMFRSTSIPFWVRMSMPNIILGNIGFFLSGHLSLGASVTILVSLGGETLRSDDFFSFSMAKSTIEIWNAGGQALALIIFFASFAWPYSKSIITMFLWFASPNNVSVSTRGNILLWLDALAKWSIIDIFVLVVTIVCLRVSIKSPGVSYLPEGLYQIDLLVIPKWGLYANMIAQLICQISSHYIIHYHRRIIEDASNRHLRIQQSGLESDDDESSQGLMLKSRMRSGSPEKLCTHAYRRAHRGESDKLVARRFVSPMLLVMALLSASLVVAGCILPTFSIDILGIIGVLVESGQAFVDAKNSYSVISMIQALFEQASLTGGVKDFLGLGSLSFLVILSVMIVPIVQILALLIQWLAPLTQFQRHRLSVSLEILQAWQYIEVYLLAVLVGSWQLGTISEYMINPYCESLQDFFAGMVYFGILKEEDAQCLKTDISVEPTFFLLFVAALVLTLMNTFVMKAERHYFSDIESANTILFHQKLGNLEDLAAIEDEIEDGICKENTNTGGVVKSIRPVPVMFSDSFRWCLCREDQIRSPQASPKELALADTYNSQDSPVNSAFRTDFSFDEYDIDDEPNTKVDGYADDGNLATEHLSRNDVLTLSPSRDMSEMTENQSLYSVGVQNVKSEHSPDAHTWSSLNSTSESNDIMSVHSMSKRSLFQNDFSIIDNKSSADEDFDSSVFS